MIDSIEKATKAVPLRANLSGISRQRFPRAVAATTQSLVNEKQTAEIVDKVWSARMIIAFGRRIDP